MIVQYADQYGTPSVCIGEREREMLSADDVIEECRQIGAIFYEDGPDDECFVLDLRDVGPELYTESALRRTWRT